MALYRALLLALLLAAVSFAAVDRLTEERNLSKKLLHDYDRLVRPRGPINGSEFGPVHVTINMYLRALSRFDDTNGEFTAQITLRQEWVDERLIFETPKPRHIELQPDAIWIPDTFFPNELQARRHEIDMPNTFIRVQNGSGQVLYSMRLTLTLSCPMYLRYFPFDRQTCNIDIASYARTTEDIVYEWKPSNPTQLREGLGASIPTFDLQDILADNCTSVTNTGTYSCLRTKISLKRMVAFYVFRLIIPSFLLVILSLVALGISHEALEIRAAIEVAALLAFTILVNGVSSRLPPNQAIHMEMWILSCYGYIVATLIESVIIHFVYTLKKLNDAKEASIRTQFIDGIARNALIGSFFGHAVSFWWQFS